MAGGQTSSRTSIKNEIDNFVSQQQRALANIVTQSIVNISHTIVQEQSASIRSDSSASNILNGYQIIVKNGAKISITQQNFLKSNAEAILNLIQDNSLILNLSNQIKNDITSTLKQNADIADKLTAAASLIKDQQISGEVNGVIIALEEIGSDLFKNAQSERERSDIKNKLVQKYITRQDAQTNLQSLISNTVSQTIKQQNLSDCVNKSTLSNIINLKRIVVDGPTATFTLSQENILDTFYKCVISSVAKSKDLLRLSNDIINTSTQSATSGLKLSNTEDASTSYIDTKKSTSWLDSLSSMIGIIIIVAVLMVFLIVMKFIKPSGNQQQSQPQAPDTMRSRAGEAWNRIGARNKKFADDFSGNHYKSPFTQEMNIKRPLKLSNAIRNSNSNYDVPQFVNRPPDTGYMTIDPS